MATVATYDTNELSLATSQAGLTQLNLTVSSSLMTNYEPSRAVDSQHAIEVAEDVAGNPMIFSVGTAGELYVITHTANPSAPWQQTDLTSGLGSGWQVETFTVLQTLQQTLYLAAAMTDSASQPHLYLTGALPNDPTNSAWTSPFTARWVERAFAEGFTGIGEILMAPGPSPSAPPVVVVTATLPTGEAQRYYVNGDVTSQLDLWQPWPVPQNASAILDVVPGAMPVLGAGSFVLYTVGAVTQLDFTKAEMMKGQYISRSFAAPDGAQALAALPNPDGTLDLYIAGNGIYRWAASAMGPGGSAQLIGATANATAGTELVVRQDSASIAVWVLDGGVLSYMQGTKAAPMQWTPPLPVQRDVGQIAALRNTVRDTNELFLVTADEQLGYLYQDPTSTMWKEMLIPLADVGSALPFSCYTTQITLTDQDGQPVTSAFTLGASEWTYLTINGAAHIVDPNTAATVTPDPTGKITVISKVSSLSTPTLFLGAAFLSVIVDINPQAIINGNLKLFATQAALSSATTQTGQPVISGQTQIPVATAASALAQLTALQDAAVGTSSSSSAGVSTRAPTAPPSNRIDTSRLPANFGFAVAGVGSAATYQDAPSGRAALPDLAAHGMRASAQLSSGQALVTVGAVGDDVLAFFGDVMETIENGLDAAGDFIVQVANDVATFSINLAGQVMSFVLDTVEKVMRVTGWLLEQLEIGLEKAIDWLGFIFDWDDIRTAHRILVNVANQGLDYVEGKLANAKDIVADFFENLKAQFNQLPTSFPGTDGQATVLGRSQNPSSGITASGDPHTSYFKSPGGNFASYHLQHSGVLQAAPPSPPPPPSGNPIVDVFTQVIEPVGADIDTTLENLFLDLRNGFVTGTLTPDGALAQLKTDAILGVLNTAEAASTGTLTVAEDLVSSIKNLVEDDWSIPFLTPLYELISGGSPLNLLDALALLIAIPAVPFYRLVTERSPFPNGTLGLDDASVAATQFFANLSMGTKSIASPAAAVAGAALAAADPEPAEGASAAILYSQIGGLIYCIAETFAMTMDAIEAEAGEAPPVLSYLRLATEVVMQAASFPVGDGSAVALLRVLWGFYWAATLRHVAQIISGGTLTPAVGVVEIFLAVGKALFFVGAIVMQTAGDSGTELALEWETFVGNLLDALARGVGGSAKVDPDKELSGLALDVIAVWVSIVAILFDGVRLGIVLVDDSYNEFHAF